MESRLPLLSIVVPVYNEEDVLPATFRRISSVLDKINDMQGEIIFVNDGSSDSTQAIIDELCECDPRVASIELSRNFGKEIAMTAGLDHAGGNAVIIIDADLQDPPELIPELLMEWRNGFDVVYAQRKYRRGEPWLKRVAAVCFYRLIKKMIRLEVPVDTGDFRLLSRRALQAVLELREHHRYMKGVFAWVGFPAKAVLYQRDPRAAGSSKFSYWKLWNLALEGLTSSSILPLKAASYLGLLISLSAFVYCGWIIFKTLLWGEAVQGYPTIMVTVLFLGGVQIFFIGIFGEYLGRVFNETKKRPLYFVQDYRPARETETTPVSYLRVNQ